MKEPLSCVLFKADSLVLPTRSVGASSAACLLSALTYNASHACGVPAGGNEQSAEDHLARRRDGETAGLPDVHPIKGSVPSLGCCNVTFTSTRMRRGSRADVLMSDSVLTFVSHRVNLIHPSP